MYECVYIDGKKRCRHMEWGMSRNMEWFKRARAPAIYSWCCCSCCWLSHNNFECASFFFIVIVIVAGCRLVGETVYCPLGRKGGKEKDMLTARKGFFVYVFLFIFWIWLLNKRQQVSKRQATISLTLTLTSTLLSACVCVCEIIIKKEGQEVFARLPGAT